MVDNVIPFPGPAEYTVRIDLVDADPPIWRRVRLHSDLTLDRVHRVVQRVMGWQDTHLHRFFGPVDGPVFLTEYDEDMDEVGIPESSVRLDRLLRAPGETVPYEYDFGDGWEHLITLEESSSYDADGPPAVCVAGERSCPPEDLGGIHHYNNVVAWLASPDPDALLDDDHLSETFEWLPLDFDAALFDVDETNRLLALFEVPARDIPCLAYQSLTCHLDPRGRQPLDDLVALADLRAGPPSDDEIARAVAPYLTLLDVVGADGLALTSAGYLPPAETARLFGELGYDDPWPGMGTREASTPPVRQLRESAQGVGLVRRHRGRLVRTPAGRALHADAAGLWTHLADTLPLGGHDMSSTPASSHSCARRRETMHGTRSTSTASPYSAWPAGRSRTPTAVCGRSRSSGRVPPGGCCGPWDTCPTTRSRCARGPRTSLAPRC